MIKTKFLFVTVAACAFTLAAQPTEMGEMPAFAPNPTNINIPATIIFAETPFDAKYILNES